MKLFKCLIKLFRNFFNKLNGKVYLCIKFDNLLKGCFSCCWVEVKNVILLIY